MQTVTGTFESGAAAREAVGRLRDAGFAADDIAFVISRRDGGNVGDAIEQAAGTGRRFGALASDVGETTVQFVPFIGRNLSRAPLARAFRQAVEEAGESAGRIVAAATEGGLTATSDFAGRDGRCASVVVRVPNGREAEAAAVLTASGAAETEVEGPRVG